MGGENTQSETDVPGETNTEPRRCLKENAHWWKQRAVYFEGSCLAQMDVNRVTEENMRSFAERAQASEDQFSTCYDNLYLCQRAMERQQASSYDRLLHAANELERVRVGGQDMLIASEKAACRERDAVQREREKLENARVEDVSAFESKIETLQKDLSDLRRSAAATANERQKPSVATVYVDTCQHDELDKFNSKVVQQKGQPDKHATVATGGGVGRRLPEKLTTQFKTNVEKLTAQFKVKVEKLTAQFKTKAVEDRATIDRLTAKTVQDSSEIDRLSKSIVSC